MFLDIKEQCVLIYCIPSHLKEIHWNLLVACSWEMSVDKKKGGLYLLEFMVLLDLMISSVMVYAALIDPNEL